MKDLLNSLAGKLLLLAVLIIVALIWLSRPKAPWNEAARLDFYSRDQGSRIMPLAWMQALKQPNGQPFLADSLSRYGYLPNPASPTPGLPVGFVANGPADGRFIGMTCSACHTREIEVNGTAHRIDGGPAIVDFQSFLADLDKAVEAVANNDPAFAAFAKAVLGPSPASGDVKALRDALELWYLRFHTLIEKALPTPAWGPSRLDAVAMIFNRLTGLDIGKPPSYLIPDNIKRASAPTRYPFIWNAPVQDFTQWPAFAQNGNDLLGLSRNLGEVYGVFADFHPKPDPNSPTLKFDYLGNNSANFPGLLALENLVKRIPPPKWPFPIDAALAEQGKAIFARATAQGGCVECHGKRQGEFRFTTEPTWATPIQDVGTDSREHDILKFVVDTGELVGAKIPILTSPLQPQDAAFSVLATSVLGSILQEIGQGLGISAAAQRGVQVPGEPAAIPATTMLKGAFTPTPTTDYPYESRVLEGVWAVAPYLHNGSVPSLAELLKPASERVKSFKIGPAYDIENVGLATEQTKFDYTLQTTDCADRNSGNSRCGHEYGTKLSPDEKRALLEYLKEL